MSAAGKKLRDQSGVSILLGILFLAVCVVVGTVVLTASTAAAGKLTRLRESEQDYQTAASAARLLRNRIGLLTFTYTHIEVKVNGVPREDLVPDDNDKTEFKDLDGTLISMDNYVLGKELLEMCKIITPKYPPEADPPAAGGEMEFQIYREKDRVDEDTVYGTIKMEKGGRILARLWMGEDNETEPKNHNRVELSFAPEGPVTETKVETEEIVVDIIGGEELKAIKETITYTTTCSWPEENCVIRKGAPPA